MERFIIKPQADIPVSDATLLDHGSIVETITKFINSDQMITPLSIAIHGDWGSGKTSLMKTLEKKLQEKLMLH
jgi:tRNA A37 threonylcarbamoyladenosine biosynthesis protein TsaE